MSISVFYRQTHTHTSQMANGQSKLCSQTQYLLSARSVYMKKEYGKSTEKKHSSALLYKSIYFQSPVFRNLSGLILRGDRGFSLLKKKTLVLPRSQRRCRRSVWAHAGSQSSRPLSRSAQRLCESLQIA